MRRLTTCPGPMALEQLLEDRLDRGERRLIERHLDGCDACQTQLEELTYDAQGMPRAISCPEKPVLRRYHEGTLGDHAWETIEHHIETCTPCRATVRRLEQGDEIDSGGMACPSTSLLRALVHSRLGPSDQTSIERHLQDCSACQARLESLVGGDAGWPERVRSLRAARPVESPELRRVIGSLKQEANDGNVHPHDAAVPDQAPILHFLDPPEADGDLGKFGPYRVVQVLGQGGMGLVMRAFDPSLNRPIAIKVLAPQLASSGPARQRFLREARAAAAIRDEHVVAIHAVDEWKGLPYLVMELIPGISLQERLDREAPLDLSSVLRIGMQTARGLAAAHAQGLVHRDIKPSNILLENGVERVKLTDFGLARAVDDASLTQSGVVAGTPLYMSPEQARGETLDHRSDLFSLGAVMYAMGTGRPPFRASTTLGVLRRVCDDEHRPIREINPDVPEWLAELVDRLLAKDRLDRFQTAREVADVLGDRLAHRQRGPSVVRTSYEPARPQPVLATDDVGPTKGERPHRNRWVIWIPMTAAVLMGLFMLSLILRRSRLVERLAADLGLQTPLATLSVQRDDPHLRILIDGREAETSSDPGYSIVRARLQPGTHHVEGFAGDRKTEGYMVEIRPGRSLTLRFRGRIAVGVESISEGSVPAGPEADPHRNRHASEYLKLCRDRLAVARERAKHQKERVAWAEEMLRKGYVNTRAVDDEKRRLADANQELFEAEVAGAEAERALVYSQPLDEQQLRDEISKRFYADPEVAALTERIQQVRDAITKIAKETSSNEEDSTAKELMIQLELLRKRLNALWTTKSEELRKSLSGNPLRPE